MRFARRWFTIVRRQKLINYRGSIETPMVDEARRISSEREGMVLTREDANEEVALKRTGKPEEVASLIAFLLSAESSYITGLACRVDGGWIC